jgi:glucose-1-phosphate adenylyltransferase
VRAAEEIGEYWRDVGTLDAYFEANLDLTDTVPRLNMYDRDWRIWTDQVVAARPSSCMTRKGGAARRCPR